MACQKWAVGIESSRRWAAKKHKSCSFNSGEHHGYFCFSVYKDKNKFIYQKTSFPKTISKQFSPTGKIFIPARVDEIAFHPQKFLIESAPDDFGWKLGGFALNFIELDELTKGYQDIPVDKIKIILEKELERSSGAVSAFGLSIPFSIVSKFGVLAIIVVQIYLLL